MAIPAELTKKPKTLKEFQEFFFYWEPNEDVMKGGGDTRTLRLALWNAKRIKGKPLTELEADRISRILNGVTHHHLQTYNSDNYSKKIHFKGWKDSDNLTDLGSCFGIHCDCRRDIY